MQDGDIEHQPGPGNWFNAHNFPGLYYEGTLRCRKLEGLLIPSSTTAHSRGTSALMGIHSGILLRKYQGIDDFETWALRKE
eukprot:7686532-Heterocapsa_arctica.AAC.1